MLIIFNLRGLLMLAIAFGVAMGLGPLAGVSAEGPMMIIAGPLCLAMDLGYRFIRGEREWLSSEDGGALFFIPIWIFGVLWFVLGIVYTVRGRA